MGRIIILVFLFGIAFADTRSGMETKVRLLINDKVIPGVTPYFPTATISDLFNVAQYEVVDLTWCLVFEQKISLTANVTYYSLNTDVFAVFRVKVGTTSLDSISVKTLDADYPNWENTAGTPERYFIKIPTHTNNMMIGFHPISDSTQTAYVNYAEIVDEMTTGSNIPFNSRRRLYSYHYLLVLRVASILAGQRGDTTLSRDLMEQYMWRLKSMEETIRMKPGEIPALIYSPLMRPAIP